MARTAEHADLNALLVFAAVAENGGFTAAAERLGATKARVSLDISRLEEQLGTTLFARTTRRVTLTDSGQALYAECIPALREVLDTLASLAGRDGDHALSGTLRISGTVDHAVQSLSGNVAAFAELHPGLQVELRSSDRVSDLVKEGIDLAIRFGWLRDSSLHATRLGEFEQHVVAAPAYLERAGTPRTPQQLASHAWVALTLLPTPLTWKFSHARQRALTVRMAGRLRCDSSAALRGLLESGAGISVLDSYSTAAAVRAGRLVRLLPQWQLPRGGIYAVYAPGRHVQPKVRAFIDFYVARLSEEQA